MVRAISSRMAGFASVVTTLMLVLTGFVASSSATSAQGVPFDCSGVVANGGFESPLLPTSGSYPGEADGWNGSYRHLQVPPNTHGGVQVISLNRESESGVATQTLNTTGLSAGVTITISLWYDEQVTVSLGSSAITTERVDSFDWTNATISYTLISDEESLELSISQGPGAEDFAYLDDVTATCAATPVSADDQSIDVAYEGTFNGTLTASGGVNELVYAEVEAPSKGSVSISPDGSFTYSANPGQSGTDTFTFSVTDSGIDALTDSGTVTVTIAAAPTPEPSPTPDPTSAPDPIPDTQLAVTADPRFTITGSAAIVGHDNLMYALGSSPSNGTATINASGQFAYIANNIWLSGDQFTLIATAPDGETATVTVTITYAIDKTVPTQGEVKPGGSNGGGSVSDARGGDSSQPEPTFAPSDDDDGRVERP